MHGLSRIDVDVSEDLFDLFRPHPDLQFPATYVDLSPTASPMILPVAPDGDYGGEDHDYRSTDRRGDNEWRHYLRSALMTHVPDTTIDNEYRTSDPVLTACGLTGSLN